jgi:hypothetical protein
MIKDQYAANIIRAGFKPTGWDGCFTCWRCMKRDVRSHHDLCKYCGRMPSDQKGGQLPIGQWSLEQLVVTQTRGSAPGDASWLQNECCYTESEMDLVYGG